MKHSAAHNNRILWIDAMRGITMILVLFSHVQISSLGLTHSIVNNFFSMFRMPLFFFVSGFIAYQASHHWSAPLYAQRLLHKTQVQLLPMIFFGLLYSATIFAHKYHCSIPVAFRCFALDHTHLGYWFTLVLLLMFVIYYTLSLIFRSRTKQLQWSLAAIAAVFYLLSLLGIQFYTQFTIAKVLCLHQLFLYFQFFVIGNIVSRHRSRILRPLGSQRICLAVVAGFIVLFAAYRLLALGNFHSALFRAGNKALLEAVRLCGMFAVVALCYRFRNLLGSTSRVSRCIRFVGRRTLDIYLIHFFLLPFVGYAGIFYDFDSHVVALTLFSFVAAVVLTIVCLLISRLIRISPFLAHLLFGAKKASKA